MSSALSVEQLSRELMRLLRGTQSQRAYRRALGFTSNVAYSWETGRRFPEASVFLRAAGRKVAGLEAAYLAQTLELPRGHAGHLWAEQRGYVLSIGDDRCAAPSSTLISVRLSGDVLEEAGRLELPGTGWQLAQASDQLALLTRTVGDLNQHALVDADGTRLTLRGLETRPVSVQVSLFADHVWFAP